jgi:hypothetical protein
MNHRIVKWLGAAMSLTFALGLAGCAAPKPLYSWGSYQTQVYDHFKGESDPQKQIAALEQALEKSRATGAHPPPGLHAHLGLLYMTVGRNDMAAQSWATEKSLFPESTQYMDFLLNNMKKAGG